MNRRVMQIGVVLALMAMAFFAGWPFWSWRMHAKAVSAASYQRTKALVDRNPQLQPAWVIAMQDDVLSRAEAKVIVESAGEKLEPEE